MITEGNKILLREQQIKNDVALKKLEKKLQKTQDEIDYDEIEEYIKIEYPDGLDIVKDRNLIKEGVKKIIPLKCKDCKVYKVFPYDFLAVNGRDYQSDRCKVCTEIINKPCKKYQENHKITCECGIKYVGYESAIIKHNNSKQHTKRMEDMIYGIRYTQKELISLSKLFKVPYYKKLTKDEMIKELIYKLADDLTDVFQPNSKMKYKCIVNDDIMGYNGTHRWEEYKCNGEELVLVGAVNRNVPNVPMD
jgi:hypothetical protein